MAPTGLTWGHLILLEDLSGELWHHFCTWALKKLMEWQLLLWFHTSTSWDFASVSPLQCVLLAEVQSLLHERNTSSEWGIWDSVGVFFLGALSCSSLLLCPALSVGNGFPSGTPWTVLVPSQPWPEPFPKWVFWVWSLRHWALEGRKAQMWKPHLDPWRKIHGGPGRLIEKVIRGGTTGVLFPGSWWLPRTTEILLQ